MDVREKLWRFVKEAIHSWESDVNMSDHITDNLISHGVTVQEWISVKDMPLEEYEYKTVLYYDGKNVDPCLVLNGKFIDIYTDCGSYIDGVTHLMPLPQPPKGE